MWKGGACCKLWRVTQKDADYFWGMGWAATSRWWAIFLHITCSSWVELLSLPLHIMKLLLLLLYFFSQLLNRSCLNPQGLLLLCHSPPHQAGGVRKDLYGI